MRLKLTNSKLRINWLILLMTLSLTGITGIQAYWLNKSYHVEAEKFDQNVAEALKGVSSRLETLETIDFLYDNIQLQPLFSSKANPLIGFENNPDTSLKIESAEGAYRVKVIFGDDSLEVFESKSESSPGLYYTKSDTNYRLAMKDPSMLMGKFRKMDAVFNQMILKSFEHGKVGAHKLTRRHLDSILAFELQAQGVKLDYEYCVNEDGEQILTSDGWAGADEQVHQAALFPGDFFGHSTLMVNFPGKANYLLSSMWLTLMISLIFTTAIIFTFYRTVSYSLQQKRISDVKTDFINNMTHEFKTPIATINLAIDALKNPRVIGDIDRIKHYSEIIRQENQRMNLQVESVLRMALMDKKELELSFEPIVMQDLLKSCVDHISLKLESRSGKLTQWYHDQNARVMGDPNHLSNTVINLLDNALKYSIGSPEVKLTTEQTRDQFILIVSDKGIGMSREEQKHIFDRFFRVGSGNIHNIKGHGLGLSYARGIVESHGGRIEVESERNRGSKFYVYLPLHSENEN